MLNNNARLFHPHVTMATQKSCNLIGAGVIKLWGPHFHYDFGGPFCEFGDPQNNSISTVNTLRIYGCDGFDAKIANNTMRIEVSGQLYTGEALSCTAYFFSVIFR